MDRAWHVKYIYIYVRPHLISPCMYIHIYKYLYACTSIFTYVSTYVHPYFQVPVCVCIYLQVFQVCWWIADSTLHTCAYIHIHSWIAHYTHKHTCTWIVLPFLNIHIYKYLHVCTSKFTNVFVYVHLCFQMSQAYRWIADSRDEASAKRLEALDDTYKLYRLIHTYIWLVYIYMNIYPHICANKGKVSEGSSWHRQSVHINTHKHTHNCTHKNCLTHMPVKMSGGHLHALKVHPHTCIYIYMFVHACKFWHYLFWCAYTCIHILICT